MKYQLSFAVFASVLLASSMAFNAAAQVQDPMQQRLDAIQKDILESQKRSEQMNEDFKALRKTIEDSQKYIEAQSKAAKSMAEVLDDAEKKGFTFGINPESREVLLRGWHDELGVLQQGVPAPLPPPKEAKKAETQKP
jgi:phosphoglycolate phosphatase-like HAD superfamily hydrolase